MIVVVANEIDVDDDDDDVWDVPYHLPRKRTNTRRNNRFDPPKIKFFFFFFILFDAYRSTRHATIKKKIVKSYHFVIDDSLLFKTQQVKFPCFTVKPQLYY